jgi:malonyl-CoA/methylmalonyl-CoA synthetase
MVISGQEIVRILIPSVVRRRLPRKLLVAMKEGKYYWIMGRASLDIIKSGGYKISALDIERELLSLPYISEALVVGVSDEEFGQRVGAIITIQMEANDQDFRERHSTAPHMLTLDRLRNDLKLRLASYKLPTLLRVIEGEIPKTATGKAQKKILGPLYFPPGYESIKEIQVWKSKGHHRGRSRL